MNKLSIKHLTRLMTVCSILCLTITTGHTEQRLLNVMLDNPITTEQSVAIVITGSQAKQVQSLIIDSNENKTKLSVPIEITEESVEPEFVFTASKTADGNINYSSVHPATVNDLSSSNLNLTRCEESSFIDSHIENQLSAITNLVKVRAKRRANFEAHLKQQLNQQFLDKLGNFEISFGLERPTALSSDLAPAELIDRLNRILHTLRKVPSPS